MRQRIDERTDDAAGHGAGIDGPGRPEPAGASGDRIREWLDWLGVTRLITTTVAVVAVCTGAWFLLRPPPPPSESSLPVATVASGGGVAPTVVLPLPSDAAATTSTEGGQVVVHVAGSVANPGVYEVEPGSRVDDAIRRAGGATSSADPAQLNLASPVRDGDRIYVPDVGEVVVQPIGHESAGPQGDGAVSGPIDVNRASADDLQGLPGVGPATAAAIVADRDQNGPFASFDDLERVRGIGPAKLAALDGLIET